MLGRVTHELLEATVPRRGCATSGSPVKAKATKFLDALLRQIAFLVLCALIVHPFSQRPLALWDIAVAVIGLVRHQLLQAIFPRQRSRSSSPIEAKVIKFLNLTVGKFVRLPRWKLRVSAFESW